MRTTLTIDPDVSEQINALKYSEPVGMKELINNLLRLGLIAFEAQKPGKKRSKESYTQAMSLGKSALNSLDDVSEVLALSEGDDFR